MKKSKVLSFFIAFGLLSSPTVFSQNKQDVTLILKNQRKRSGNLQETVEVKWLDVKTKFPSIEEGDFKVIDAATNREIAYQLEYKGKPTPQHLLVNVVLAAGKSMKFKIVKGKPMAMAQRVFGRYVPERKDDFAWENDKIAFRMYGKALESTNENAYGIDIWAKRTDKLIVDKWYKTGDYHADHGDGLDYYSVGFTLGGGDIAPYINNEIKFPKNYATWKILDKGPIRFTFLLSYNEWQAGGRSVKVTKQYSLDAGAQLNRVEATFDFNQGEGALPVAVGIVLRKEPGKILQHEATGITGYWEPEHGADGTIGIGTILLDRNTKLKATDSHLLTMTNATANKPVVYYNGAAWNKAGNFTNSEQWFNYLRNFKQVITEPIKVTIL